MNSKQKLINYGFAIKKQLTRSVAIGSLTDLIGLHTSRIGKVRSIISARKLENSSKGDPQFQLIRNNLATTRPKPLTLEESVHSAFEYSYSNEASEHYLLKIKDAFLLTQSGWVLTSDRKFILESIFKPEALYTKGVHERVLWPKVEHVQGRLVLACNNWAPNNYYHWLLEFLPKISAFIDPPNPHFSEIFKEARIILPDNLSPAMVQSLEMLGVQDEQLFRSTSGQLQVEQLLFIPSYGKLYSLPLWAIDWLRDRFSPYMSQPASHEKRIYISRRKAASRRVQNEDEVLQMLSRYGFEEVLLEDLDLANQISMFSQAEVVVGPHGAGFSNIVFSTRATLIDIFEPNHVNCCFYTLSHDSGQFYWYLMAETEDDVNMHVDVDKLERTLIAALEQRNTL